MIIQNFKVSCKTTSLLVFLIASLAFAYTCSSPTTSGGDDGGNGGDDTPKVPTLPTVISTTNDGNVEITSTSIMISGEVTNTGNTEIIARGVVWGTSANPTIPSTNKEVATANTFTSTITSLMADTTYHFRVYATNSVGTSYGANQSFTTLLNYVAIWSRGRFNGQLGLGAGEKSVAQLDAACASQEGLTNAVAEGVTDDDSAPSSVINSPSNYTIKAFIARHLGNQPFNFHTTNFTAIANKPLRGPKEWDGDTTTSGRLASGNADITYAEYFTASVTLGQSLQSAGVAPGATNTESWRGSTGTTANCDNWSQNIAVVNIGSSIRNVDATVANINHTEQVTTSPFDATKGRYNVIETGTLSNRREVACDQELLTLCIAFDK